MTDFVVSFTSHGQRLVLVPKMLDTLREQTIKPPKIVMTLMPEDYSLLASLKMRSWTLDGYTLKRNTGDMDVEILIAKVDLKPHLKYFYAMQKYRKHIVITVDDDRLYNPDLIERLLEHHKKHPGCVMARRCVLIEYRDGEPIPFSQWRLIGDCEWESYNLLAEGFSGCLYPPDILKMSDDEIPNIMRCLKADDLYLRWRETNLGVKVVRVPSDYFRGGRQMPDPIVGATALSAENTKKGGNDYWARSIGLYYRDDDSISQNPFGEIDR